MKPWPRRYLEGGEPVVALCGGGLGGRRGGPRNVLIRRADGTEVVRPLRGLRLPPAAP